MTKAEDRRAVHADLQAEGDRARAAQAGPRAEHAIAGSVLDVLENHSGAEMFGDVQALAVKLARKILPAMVADGWVNPSVKPIDMVLFCPKCGTQHVDASNEAEGWENPPHRSHKCHNCEHIWRPADVVTNGVLSISTTGGADDKPVISGLTIPARRPGDAPRG